MRDHDTCKFRRLHNDPDENYSSVYDNGGTEKKVSIPLSERLECKQIVS